MARVKDLWFSEVEIAVAVLDAFKARFTTAEARDVAEAAIATGLLMTLDEISSRIKAVAAQLTAGATGNENRPADDTTGDTQP